jgi:hypothetical protein
MRSKVILPLFMIFSLLTTAPGLLAHHSFTSEYDGEKPITLTGIVTKIEWTNPHCHFYVDVKDASGNVDNWKFEGFPPNMLVHNGWKKDETMRVGDTITVFGWRAKDGGKWAQARDVALPDGRKLIIGPGTGNAQGQGGTQAPPAN